MAALYFDVEADAALTRLEHDDTQPKLQAAVNRVLDQLENDPGDRTVRKNRFTIGLWAVSAHGENESWLILWEPHPTDSDGVMVHYLGPSFS